MRDCDKRLLKWAARLRFPVCVDMQLPPASVVARSPRKLQTGDRTGDRQQPQPATMIACKGSEDIRRGRELVSSVVFVILLAYFGASTYCGESDINTDGSDYGAAIRRINEHSVQYGDAAVRVVPSFAGPWGGGAGGPGEMDVVLCTQASLSHVQHVRTLADTWGGPISAAVYLSGSGDLARLLHQIRLLRECFVNVNKKVSFHLVYPMSFHPLRLSERAETSVDCKTVKTLSNNSELNWRTSFAHYPVNILRNVAIIHSASPYVFNLDVDLVPYLGLYEQMKSFLNGRHSVHSEQKTAYVIPCFETSRVVTEMLKSKSTLLQCYKAGSVQVRQAVTCPACHGPTNYSAWLATTSETDAYTVRYQDKYEPYYIAHRRHLPLFDTRFVGYGYDRVSQVCEAHVCGFEFVVIANSFVVHNGIKDKSNYPAWLINQNTERRRFYQSVFKTDIMNKYPWSSRSC